MKIFLSRHARRRAQLYCIPESAIFQILKEKILSHYPHEIIEKVNGYQYPLKIVYAVENDAVTVITVYPLKKGWKK